MESSTFIDIPADGPAGLMDAEGHGVQASARGIDGGEDAIARYEPMAPESNAPVVFAVPFLTFGAGLLVCKGNC
jgi:hypothetical protein